MKLPERAYILTASTRSGETRWNLLYFQSGEGYVAVEELPEQTEQARRFQSANAGKQNEYQSVIDHHEVLMSHQRRIMKHQQALTEHFHIVKALSQVYTRSVGEGQNQQEVQNYQEALQAHHRLVDDHRRLVDDHRRLVDDHRRSVDDHLRILQKQHHMFWHDPGDQESE